MEAAPGKTPAEAPQETAGVSTDRFSSGGRGDP